MRKSLPYEVIYPLLLNLPYDYILPFCLTSRKYYSIYLNNEFWINKSYNDLSFNHQYKEIFEKVFNTKTTTREFYIASLTIYQNRCVKGSEKYISADMCLLSAIDNNDVNLIYYLLDKEITYFEEVSSYAIQISNKGLINKIPSKLVKIKIYDIIITPLTVILVDYPSGRTVNMVNNSNWLEVSIPKNMLKLCLDNLFKASIKIGDISLIKDVIRTAKDHAIDLISSAELTTIISKNLKIGNQELMYNYGINLTDKYQHNRIFKNLKSANQELFECLYGINSKDHTNTFKYNNQRLKYNQQSKYYKNFKIFKYNK